MIEAIAIVLRQSLYVQSNISLVYTLSEVASLSPVSLTVPN